MNMKKKFEIITVLFFIALFVCGVVNFGIDQKITWAVYPFASIIFAWIVMIPIFNAGKNKSLYSLLAFSVTVIPFLYIITSKAGSITGFNKVALPISIVAIIYLWCLYFISQKLGLNGYYFAAITAVSISVLDIICQSIVSKVYNSPFNIWNIFVIVLSIMAGVILFVKGKSKMKI